MAEGVAVETRLKVADYLTVVVVVEPYFLSPPNQLLIDSK